MEDDGRKPVPPSCSSLNSQTLGWAETQGVRNKRTKCGKTIKNSTCGWKGEIFQAVKERERKPRIASRKNTLSSAPAKRLNPDLKGYRPATGEGRKARRGSLWWS